MKKQFLLIAISMISLSVFSQTPHNTASMTVTEDQIVLFSTLLNAGVNSEMLTNSNQISTAQLAYYKRFNDSCQKSWQAIYAKWHPAPPPAPKKDSTSAPKK